MSELRGTAGPETPRTPGSRRAATRAAWITVLLLAVASLLLVGLDMQNASLRNPDAPPEARVPVEHTLSKNAISALMDAAAPQAERAALDTMRGELDAIFEPVHAAVPAYADFHYSLLGEYTELTEAALRSVSSTMEKRLFDGFDKRLARSTGVIDAAFAARFEAALLGGAEAEAATAGQNAVLSQASQLVLGDTVARARTTKPIEAMVAAGAATISARTTATVISKTLLKGIGKLAAKSALRPVGVGGGAAAGALAGTWLGPIGAAMGGAIGGAAAWLGMDYAILKIDEIIGREDFEAELHALIDTERNRLESLIAHGLAERRHSLSGRTIREVRAAAPSVTQ